MRGGCGFLFSMTHLPLLIAAIALTHNAPTDSLATPADTIEASAIDHLSGRLTEKDYKEIADELGIETAAIKAVVEIEAGQQHRGFFAPDMPLINFDLTMFRQAARRNGVNLSRYSSSHKEVFSRPNTRKYGSQQAAQHARLSQAKEIDYKTAVEGTFWGMFQIGGFNWKLCKCESITDFEQKMARSERDQLELFAHFIQSTGLVKYLKNKNWSAFALRYNGKSYAARGYHTRLARAYRKYSKN